MIICLTLNLRIDHRTFPCQNKFTKNMTKITKIQNKKRLTCRNCCSNKLKEICCLAYGIMH